MAGTHKYVVPSNISRLKIQAWGAGGGSGYFLERKVGYGGGGAFIEVILEVNAFDVLEIVVGSGGQGGNNGIFVEDIDVSTHTSFHSIPPPLILSLTNNATSFLS